VSEKPIAWMSLIVNLSFAWHWYSEGKFGWMAVSLCGAFFGVLSLHMLARSRQIRREIAAIRRMQP